MPSGEARIKLTVDSADAQRGIRDIDDQLKNLGQNRPQPDGPDTAPDGSPIYFIDYTGILRDIHQETVQIRRTAERLASQYNGGTGNGGNPQPAPANPPVPPVPPVPPANPSGTPPANPPAPGSNNPNNNLPGMLGKLSAAIGMLYSAQRLTAAFSGMANSAQTGQSLAYRVYGSTNEYRDYNRVRHVAGETGSPYGYNSDQVMYAANANINAGGFESDETHQADMTSILQASKVFGLEPTQLANAAGNAVAVGTVELGDQRSFVNLFAESIERANMTGREAEQLRVLETISGQLEQTNATVSKQTLTSGMSLYNALVNTNQDLRGDRGAQAVTNLSNLAQSGNMSLDILAGWGTEYTGIQGRLKLNKLAREDPNQYYRQVYEGYTQRFGDNNWDGFQLFLENHLSNPGEAEDIIQMLRNNQLGQYDITGQSVTGETLLNELTGNYDQAGVSTDEEYEAQKDNTKQDVGNIFNTIFRPFKSIWSGLGDGAQGATTGIGTAVGSLLPMAGWAVALKGLPNILKTLTGAAAPKGASGSILAGLGKLTGLSGLAGGVNPATVSATAGTVGKRAGAVGTVLEVGSTALDVTHELSEGDSRNAASELGQGVGHIAGGWGGMLAGAKVGAAIGTAFGPVGTAVGGIIGGIGGSIAGNALGGTLGEATGEAIHDTVTETPQYTAEQAQKIQELYARTRDIYDTQGAKAAHEYTIHTVMPELEQAGVSESYTKHYKWDVGENDFIKDVENGAFGDLQSYVAEQPADTRVAQPDEPVTHGTQEHRARAGSFDKPESGYEVGNTSLQAPASVQSDVPAEPVKVPSQEEQLVQPMQTLQTLSVEADKVLLNGVELPDYRVDTPEPVVQAPVSVQSDVSDSDGKVYPLPEKPVQSDSELFPDVKFPAVEQLRQPVVATTQETHMDLGSRDDVQPVSHEQYQRHVSDTSTQPFGEDNWDSLQMLLETRTTPRQTQDTVSHVQDVPTPATVSPVDLSDIHALMSRQEQSTVIVQPAQPKEDNIQMPLLPAEWDTDELSDTLESNTRAVTANTLALSRSGVTDLTVPVATDTGSNSKTVDNSGKAQRTTATITSAMAKFAATYGKNTGIATPMTGKGENTAKINEILSHVTMTPSTGENAKTRAVGQDYVPYDGYPAILHEGEAVLTKLEAEDYRKHREMPDVRQQRQQLVHEDNAEQPVQASPQNATLSMEPINMTLNVVLSGSVGGMTGTNQQQIVQAVVAQIRATNLQDVLKNGWMRVQNV